MGEEGKKKKKAKPETSVLDKASGQKEDLGRKGEVAWKKGGS